MNTSLQRTYDCLATTSNTAAVDLLVETFNAGDDQDRQSCVDALIRRDSDLAFAELLNMWSELSDLQQQSLADASGGFCRYVEGLVGEDYGQRWNAAVQVIRQLSVHSSVPALVHVAESAHNPRQKNEATLAVLELTSQLGDATRRGCDHRIERRNILDRLLLSLRSLDQHQCFGMIDAFLSMTTWSDSMLQSALSENSSTVERLAGHLNETTNSSVLDLLAGWITRKRIPDAVVPVLRARSDKEFRNHLLRHVTASPTNQTLRNLAMLKTIAAFRNSDVCWQEVDHEDRAALIHVLDHLSTDREAVRVASINLLEVGDEAAVTAASKVLKRMSPMPITGLMPEAIELSVMLDSNEPQSALRHSLLWRQMQCLDHPFESAREAAKISLANLQAEEFFEHHKELSISDISHIGPVILAIDPHAESYVVEELKHTIISRRMAAVDAAAGLGIIDSLLHRIRAAFDHSDLEMKIQIAKALHHGHSDKTRQWLNELSAGEPGPIRDAARGDAALHEVQ